MNGNGQGITMLHEFVSSVVPGPSEFGDSWWFVFSGYRLFIVSSGEDAAIPAVRKPDSLGLEIMNSMHLGTFRGRACYAAEGRLQDGSSPGGEFKEIRSLFPAMELGFFEIALRALHLLAWDKKVQFCSRCRGLLTHREDMRAKECGSCGMIEFPRLSPAIIVLIEKKDSVLLARSSRFAGGFFSVIAGFVDPGETLEQAVHREIMEETGITVKNVVYFGSQPWPFPDSLMIGFTAEYESGEIRIDEAEIVEAAWYKVDALPLIPGRISIARQLIDWFINKHTGNRQP